jgi:uncharacterized membrane protein
LIESALGLSALIASAAALSFWVERKWPAFSRVGAALLAILFGAVISNLGLVPGQSAVYDSISGTVTSLAIAWLLLSVNVRDLRAAGRPMLIAFGLAGAGTAAGAFVGALVFGGTFGGDTWRLAGTLTGTYSGGSVNFVAVATGVELPDRLFAGTTAADALTTALWLGVTLMLPFQLKRWFPPIAAEAETGAGAGPTIDEDQEHHPFFIKERISTLDLGILLAAGSIVLVVSEGLASLTPGIPSVLWLTTLALALGHLTALGRVPGAMQLGSLALQLFFVVIGIHSRISEILSVGVEVFWLTLVIVGVHGLVVYGFGRLLKLDLATLSVASQAAVGGPSSAMAVAVAREWRGLILPGIAVGLFGYAVGNYLGFGVASLVRALGIGL